MLTRSEEETRSGICCGRQRGRALGDPPAGAPKRALQNRYSEQLRVTYESGLEFGSISYVLRFPMGILRFTQGVLRQEWKGSSGGAPVDHLNLK